MNVNYVVKSISTKDGAMRDIHRKMLGSRCYIVELEVGSHCLIKYEPYYDLGNFHYARTSPVIKIETVNEDLLIKFETENTVYILEQIDSLIDFYNRSNEGNRFLKYLMDGKI